jgi:signal transduction histidine kinase
MRQLGGRLEVTSNEAGTTVTALIPATESHEQSDLT